ncbi:MAG TPA: BTAD domain-containing putative transcriptional regulator [Acidimicrobiia bacterium]|nr:BTAD domain-containing putative transcriptional regulator [Acidimicrobiia bacterium]
MLALSLLGTPEVLVDGSPLVVDTRKATALLAYLAIEGGEHARDHLVELLWPDTDPERSRSSLRRTLSTLRTALGGRWVEADRAAVRMTRNGVTVDVDEFASLADDLHGHDAATTCPRCLPEMRRAAALFRGEFLAGFVVRDAPAFESWARIRSEQATRRADRVLQRLAAAEASAGDYSRAIETAWRRIGVDPLHEEAYRAAMLLHAWAGDRSGAVDAYRRLVAALDTELGVAPLEETSELYQAILEEDLPRAPAPRRDPVPTPPSAPALPLVDRDESIGKIVAALTPGGVVRVTTDLGMGVTTVLAAVAERMQRTGSTVLQGAGVVPAVPFGVIHDALLEALPGAPLQELPEAVLAEAGRLFPGLSTIPAPPQEAGTRTRFLDALARVIAVIPHPVMVIDDAQWCDDSSAEMLGFLAARGRHFGVALLVASTAEPESPVVGAMLDDLAARGTAVELVPLTLQGVSDLVAAAGLSLDARELHHRTGGVPLLVVETVRAAADGRGAEVPDQIRRIYTSRLDALPGVADQVLDALVILGRPSPPSLVAVVSGRSPEETDAALDHLIGRRLAVESADAAVAPVHEQLAAVVAGRHTAARRRLLHRRAASALEASGIGDPTRIARHHLAAGNDTLAATWFRTAGDAAASLYAHSEAIEHYEAALAAGHVDRAGLHRAAAHSAMLEGRYSRAIAGFEAALAEGGPVPVIEHLLGEVHRRLRRWDMAAAHYDRAYAAASDAEMQAVVAADRAFVESRRADGGDTVEHIALALRLAGDSGSARARARARNVAGLAASGQERTDHLRAALADAAEPAERMAVLNNLAAAVPDPAEAVGLAREALAIAVESGDRHLMAALHNTVADALHRAGDEAGSRRALTEAVTLFSGITTADTEPWVPEVWLLTEW